MSFLQSPRLARRPRISAARSAAWRLLARRRRRPDPAFAKTESATAASRRRRPDKGIKTSPKCQRESTATALNADKTGEFLETRRVKVLAVAALQDVAQQNV